MIIGLTGGIGSGKTFIANEFAKLGVKVINADLVAKELLNRSEIISAMVEFFGTEILTSENQIDRKKLREKIFSHHENKKFVDELIHPLVRLEMHTTTQNLLKICKYVIWEVPLLIQSQMHKLCDRVLVVKVSQATQLARAKNRDGAHSYVEQIIKAQLTTEQLLKFADDVIENDLDFSENPQALCEQVLKLDRLYCDLSKN